MEEDEEEDGCDGEDIKDMGLLTSQEEDDAAEQSIIGWFLELSLSLELDNAFFNLSLKSQS